MSGVSGYADSDQRIFSFTGEDEDAFTVRDCCTGFAVFGGTGSGKTSGSGYFLAQNLMRAGFGGLVLTVKPDEAADWQRWAASAGRSADLRFISAKAGARFDFLKYEQGRVGDGAGKTFNLVQMFKVIGEQASPLPSGSAGSGDDAYWLSSALDLIHAIIEVIKARGEPLSMSTIAGYVGQVSKASSLSGFLDSLQETRERITAAYQAGDLVMRDASDFITASLFFANHWAGLSERTTSSILARAQSLYNSFLYGEMADIFAKGELDEDLIPEVAFERGHIIVVDLPVLEWQTLGTVAQSIVKYVYQKAIERRSQGQQKRPFFIFSDEAQYFVNSADQLFLTTARSAGCSTIYLTQNIQNYYLRMGEAATLSMLGNLQTKIFHQNTDHATNEYGSQIIGRRWVDVRGRGIDAEGKVSLSGQDQQINKIEPEAFNLLRTGGIENRKIVEAFALKGGRVWRETRDVVAKVVFEQP